MEESLTTTLAGDQAGHETVLRGLICTPHTVQCSCYRVCRSVTGRLFEYIHHIPYA